MFVLRCNYFVGFLFEYIGLIFFKILLFWVGGNGWNVEKFMLDFIVCLGRMKYLCLFINFGRKGERKKLN